MRGERGAAFLEGLGRSLPLCSSAGAGGGGAPRELPPPHTPGEGRDGGAVGSGSRLAGREGYSLPVRTVEGVQGQRAQRWFRRLPK